MTCVLLYSLPLFSILNLLFFAFFIISLFSHSLSIYISKYLISSYIYFHHLPIYMSMNYLLSSNIYIYPLSIFLSVYYLHLFSILLFGEDVVEWLVNERGFTRTPEAFLRKLEFFNHRREAQDDTHAVPRTDWQPELQILSIKGGSKISSREQHEASKIEPL